LITLDIILVCVAILFILVSLYAGLFGPAFTFTVAIIFLGVCKVLTANEIMDGFGNVQIAIILLLLIWGDMVKKTAVIERLFDRFFRSAKSYNGFLARMMMVVTPLSSFINDTPLVAVMMPYVHNWCKRNNFSPSRFLIPLSFAAILGGTITLIGTSTNLIIAGMVAEQTIIPDLRPMQMFDFAWVGLPMAFFGFLYMQFVGKRLLPDRKSLMEEDGMNSRTYFIEARIRRGSYLIGQKLKHSHLLNLKGLKLVEIIRGTESLTAYQDDTIITEDDFLVFVGTTKYIAEMVESESGLVVPEIGMLSRAKKAEVIEIVVSQNSTLIGKAVREVNFRAKYDAAVLAVHRNGEQITKLEDTDMRAGDVLLMYTGAAFSNLTQASQDFYFISSVKDFVKIENYKIYILLGGLAVSVVLASMGFINLFIALLVLIFLGLIFGLTTPKELPKSIDYNLALIIVLSLALGTAMIKTGTADLISEGFIKLFLPLGNFGILIGIYIITTILAAYITTKAAVGIIFPIALTTAVNLSLPPLPFILAVAYASAANYITPHGFTTNLMVYGPGNYTFKDFMKVGLPLTCISMITAVSILYLVFLS
jgi:di/tricarboxylate transporter